MLLPRINHYIHEHSVIPDHQFGFRSNHSTIHQLHRVTDIISSNFEKRKYTSGVFLDVCSVFDKVRHEGLLFKLKAVLPDSYYLILQSFLQDRFFYVAQGFEISDIKPITAGVPQGAILSPLLYSIYTADLPMTDSTTVATYADDTILLTSTYNLLDASKNLQHHLNIMTDWLEKWRILINATKSVHVTFTLRKGNCPNVYLNNEQIPQKTEVRYLGLTLDRRLTWKPHIINKRNQLNMRLRQLYRLVGPKSPLTLNSKLTLYKTLLKPIWTYGLQIF